jgi:hypothetical protein
VLDRTSKHFRDGRAVRAAKVADANLHCLDDRRRVGGREVLMRENCPRHLIELDSSRLQLGQERMFGRTANPD